MKLTKHHFLLLVIIIYFTFIGGTFYSQLNFTLRVANRVIVTVILGVWLLAKLRQKQGLPHTYLDLPIALYLIVNLVSAIFGLSPRFSLEMMWFSVIHVLALYLLVDLIRQGWTQRLAWVFYMASAVVCLIGLAEFMAWYVGTPLLADFAQGWVEIGGWRQPIPPQMYRLNITLNGSTPLSAYLALLIPPAIGLVITLPRRNENRQALLIWLVLAFFVQILTFSRAGILALTVSLTLLFVGWARVTDKSWSILKAYWSRLTGWYRAVIICGGIGLGGLGIFWLQRSFLNRGGSTNFRFTLWQTAWHIFQDHWLLGAGPANFGRALLRFNDSTLPRIQIATAHSIYFNTAAELGLVGLIVGGVLLLVGGWAWLKRWHQATGQSDQIRLIACGAALVGLAAQTLVDTYTATPNMLIMLGLIAYIIADLRQDSIPAWQPFTTYLALAAVLIYAAGFVWIGRADFHFQESFSEEGLGYRAEAVAQAAEAHTLDPDLALRTYRLALLEARLADQINDPTLVQAAIEHYQAGLQREPILGLNSANLSGLLWQQGRRAEAIDTLERTVVAQQDPLYLVNLGYFYEQMGDWTKAGNAYGQALSISSSLAGSGFWHASSDRAERWPHFVEAAIEQLTTDDDEVHKLLRVNLALARADFNAVEVLIAPVTSTADQQLRATLAEYYLSRGQPEQAATFLEPRPKTAQDYRLAGWLKLQTAAYSQAEKLLKTATFLGDRQANYYLGQLFEQQGDLSAAETAYQRGFLPHTISENVSVNIYGRFGGNDLAPQLLRIGVGPRQAQSWLALARLYEMQRRFKEAERIYQVLLAEDPFLTIAQERLNLLAEKTSP